MTPNRRGFTLVIVLAAAPAFADVWDTQVGNDNVYFTADNDLYRGTVQVHDLAGQPGTADRDWFVMPQKAYSSYEVIVDGVTSELNLGPASVTLVASDGLTVIENSGPLMGGLSGHSRALRFANTSSTLKREYIRVGDATCGFFCDTDDQYTIRVRETTVNVARFNNSATQQTILLTQNASDVAVSCWAFFWSGTGTLLETTFTSIPAKGLAVVSLAGIGALAGQSGHLTLAHNGSHGALNVKAVAVEPATGFTFDTPGVYVPD